MDLLLDRGDPESKKTVLREPVLPAGLNRDHEAPFGRVPQEPDLHL